MKRFFSKVFRLLWKIALWSFLITLGLVLLYKWVPVPVTPLMVIRSVEQLADGEKVKLDYTWVRFDRLSPNLQLAVVCAEDQHFLTHNGFDFEAIEKALDYNESHRRKRGASTISQQTAKNLFLWPGRTWVRKGLEVYFTFLIENLWSKKRIMTVYLNIIEMGDGIYGGQAAARTYFGKDAEKLRQDEAALIAAILPNPRKYSAAKPGPYVRRRQAWIMNQMDQWGGVLDYNHPPIPEKKTGKKERKK